MAACASGVYQNAIWVRISGFGYYYYLGGLADGGEISAAIGDAATEISELCPGDSSLLVAFEVAREP